MFLSADNTDILEAKPLNKFTLPLVLVKSFQHDFLSAILPRLSLILFRYLQPTFIGFAIDYVRSASSETGLYLVLYATVIYVGLAVCKPEAIQRTEDASILTI